MTACSALAAVRARHGESYSLEGRCPGGEAGAYFARAADGRRFVFKWTDDAAALEHLSKVVARVARLRAKCFPAPLYYPPCDVDDGVVIFQEAVAGEWHDEVDHDLLDELFELNNLQAGEADGEAWTEYMVRTLTEGAEGYCVHESLRQHSTRTRQLLSWIEAIGAGVAGLPCDDLVHLDFHHRNVLRADGAISAVVDWEGCIPGDRAFDIVTLWYGMTHARADGGIESRIWDRARELADTDVLVAYFAHMALRRLDWTIRHHDGREVMELLDFIDRGRARLRL